MPSTRRRALRGLVVAAALLLAATASYTVESGDTLSAIAARFNTTVAQLAEINGLDNPDRIVAGRQLDVPGPAGDTSQPASAGTHVLAPGETLSAVALRAGVSVRALVEANSITDPDRVLAGQRLSIPPAGSTAQPSADPASGAAAGAPAAAAGRAETGALLERIARDHGWNPAFVKAIAWQESGWRNTTVSSQGAIGIMQVMPATGEWVSTHLAGRHLDLNDPAENVLAGVLFLDYLHDVTDGDPEKILAGYYQGLRSVENHGRFPSTQRYIDNVMALRDRF